MHYKTLWVGLAVLVVGVGVALSVSSVDRGHPPGAPTSAEFYCAEDKTIDATFTPAAVSLNLSDGRTLTLAQTVSGSGARYEATTTTSDIVFWNEGDNAFITENEKTTYEQCVTGLVETNGPDSKIFINRTQTFSFAFPNAFSVQGSDVGYTQNWMVNATTSGLILAQINIPKSYAPGTNFGDAKFTVGTSADPSAVAACLTPVNGETSVGTLAIHGVTYTKLTMNDAGAGNRYDTTSYRVVRGGQCYALEYTIHYSVFENYPAGAVTRFDEVPLAATLDQIAHSFKFLQ